jgi:hypothetical protein
MDQILAQRFSFCDFSKIVGFPNPPPSRDEWESSLPRFRGKGWEAPAEHLLDFHEFIHRLHIVHEDIQINLFKYSLQGIAHDWCRSLPVASINSLTSFHAAFNSFYKDYFPAECLYENCCDEFSLFYKDSACHKDQFCDEVVIVEESIFHEEHEVLNDIHYDRDNIETSGIISDVSVVLSVHEDQHVSSEYPNVEEQVYSAEDFSPDYEAEIDEKLAAKAREGSSMFFPSFSESKAEFVCCSYKGNAEDIPVLETVSEKISPGISQPASVLHPPVYSENIERWVSNNEVQEVISYQSSFPDYKFCDPVGLYMELCFPKALEPAKLFILSSFRGISSVPIHVFFMLSYFPYLLWIICSKEKNYITEQSGWLWWKFSFT